MDRDHNDLQGIGENIPGMPPVYRTNWPETILVLLLILCGYLFVSSLDYATELERENADLHTQLEDYKRHAAMKRLEAGEIRCIDPAIFARNDK